MNAIISVQGLVKEYKDVAAVKNISFDIATGKCFGLLGPNGAGKTTTIEMMEGLTKPTRGEIKLFGNVLDKNALDKIGIQFQQTALQDFLTVTETINLFSSFYQTTRSTQSLIEMCDLTEVADRNHQKLSGGQKQRLLLALALVNDPEVIFLDEPTTGLDPHARRNFWDLLTKIKNSGKTIIITTHYMDEAQYLCDEIAIMNRGEIIAHDSPDNLLQQHFSGAIIRLPQENLPDCSHFENIRPYGDGFYDIDAVNVEETITDLLSRGISLEGLQVKSANLDDLFIKLTGQALNAETTGDVADDAVAGSQTKEKM